MNDYELVILIRKKDGYHRWIRKDDINRLNLKDVKAEWFIRSDKCPQCYKGNLEGILKNYDHKIYCNECGYQCVGSLTDNLMSVFHGWKVDI